MDLPDELKQEEIYNRRMREDCEFREAEFKIIIADLMTDREDFYPWSMGAIEEALSNMNLGDSLFLCSSIASSANLPENPYAQQQAAYAVRCAIESYWKKMARQYAEKAYPL